MDAASCCTRPGAEDAPVALGAAIDGDACARADADEPPDVAEGAGVEEGDDDAAPFEARALGLRAAAGVLCVGARDSITGADPCDPEMSSAATSATATVAAAPTAERR
jgi:hypothetical protein